ncbi:MAG: hypothetical protein M3Y87_19520 [Myxococcota bacterium]|nr:hypothetical protein [Myxococcota bacterium]
MNRVDIRPAARLASLVGVALLGACSAIVSPDTSRLEPSGVDGGSVDGGRVDSGHVDSGPLDGGAVCPTGCDDAVACTVDTCEATGCAHVTDDSACGADERCNAVMGCVPLRCSTNAECDDGSACTGDERCDPGATTDPSGCVSGTPTACDDGLSCTNDLCVDAAGGCIFMPSDAGCDDGIECTTDACAPADPARDAAGCVHPADDALCDDGFCFTGGRCNASSGCVGAMPRACPDDGDACTAESCDPALSMCVSAPIDGCTAGTGETCAMALPIAIDAATGRGTVSGVLSAYADDYAFCMSSSGRDAVFYFDVTTLSDVTIDTMGSSADTVLAVAFDCSTAPTICNDDRDPGAGTTSRIFLHRMAPAIGSASLRVYVFVDGYSASSTGAFTLEIAIAPARPDSCAEPLDITGGGTVLGLGPFGATPTGPSGSCQGFSDRGDGEGVFRMRPPSDRAHDQIDAYSTTFVPEIYIRTGCMGGSELDCDIGSAVGGGINAASISTGSVSESSTQYLFVDGMVGTTPAGGPHGYVVVYDP